MKLNKAVRDNVFKLLQVTELVRKEINAEIPPQQMVILYIVALNEGISHGEIANLLAMPEGTVSRNISKLSERIRRTSDGRIEKIGYGLLDSKRDYEDIRKKCVYLTDKGAHILRQLASLLD